MNEEIGHVELTEVEKSAIIKIAQDLCIGENLRIINPSEEEVYEDFVVMGETDDTDEVEVTPKKDNIARANIKTNTEVDLQSIMKFQDIKDNTEIRKKLINDQLKFSKNIELIDLDQLIEVDSSINFFALPNDEEFLDLASSMEVYGIINPLIVIRDKETGKYIVLVGRSRLYVARSLFAETSDMRFFRIPCIELDSSTDPALIQGLVISTNIKYRKLSREDFIRSILTLDEILAKTKRNYRSEMNIADVIAKQAGVSRTTVNNYRELKYLCPMGMDLVNKKHMNLNIARMLSHKDRETQEIIIKGLGRDINDVRKVKAMMEGPAKSIYDAETKTAVKETWDMKTTRTKNMVPTYTYITVKVGYSEVETVMKNLTTMRKDFAIKYAATKKNSINRFLKVSVRDRDMVQYVNRGFLKQETLDKALSTEFNDVIKTA